MIRAGVPLARALSILSLQTKSRSFKKVITELTEEVRSGMSLSTSMAKRPSIFPELAVAMVGVGELSGNLEKNLEEVAIQMRKDFELKRRVRGALILPAIILTALIGVTILMLTVVLPKLITIFEESDIELPLATRMVVGITGILSRYGFWVALVAVAVIIGLVALLKSDKGKRTFHLLALRMPIVGEIMRKINLARFARTMGSLLGSGISIVKAIEVSSGVVGNVTYRAALLTASTEVKRGTNLHSLLSQHPLLFPPLVTQMVGVGEETGTIETVLHDLADFYEAEVEEILRNMASILEPVLTLMLGLGVGGIALAIIQPIYTLITQVQ